MFYEINAKFEIYCDFSFCIFNKSITQFKSPSSAASVKIGLILMTFLGVHGA